MKESVVEYLKELKARQEVDAQLNEEDAKITPEYKWGENLMGKALVMVRNDVRHGHMGVHRNAFNNPRYFLENAND